MIETFVEKLRGTKTVKNIAALRFTSRRRATNFFSSKLVRRLSNIDYTASMRTCCTLRAFLLNATVDAYSRQEHGAFCRERAI